jgi:hypothetical protein
MEPELSKPWIITASDRALVMKRHHSNRLSFAVLLLFFREHGRFPGTVSEVDRGITESIARQFAIEMSGDFALHLPERTGERHRAEIRAALGFREATVADAEALEAWLRDQIPTVGAIPDQLTTLVETRRRELSIESPTPDRVERIVRAAIHAHDERFQATILSRLSPESRARLEALLRSAEDGSGSPPSDPSAQPAPALLLQLRADPGRPGLAGVQEALARLELVREIALPSGLFDGVLPHELDRYRRRVSTEAPYEPPPPSRGRKDHLACDLRASARPDADR